MKEFGTVYYIYHNMIKAIRRYFASIKNNYRIFSNEKIVSEAFLSWAEGSVNDGCGVVVKLCTQKRYFKKQGSELVAAGDAGKVQFILTTPGEIVGEVAGVIPVRIFASDCWKLIEEHVARWGVMSCAAGAT